MKAYSGDLRRKIVRATERGVPKARAARLLGVSLSSVKRYARLARRGGSLAPGKGSGRPPKIGENAKKLLGKDVEERPAATVSQRRRFLEHITGEEGLSDSTVGRVLKRMDFSKKTERRVGGKGRVLEGGLEDDDRREALCGSAGVRGRDGLQHLPGAPVRLGAQGRAGALLGPEEPRFKNTTRLASMTVEGMGPCLAVEGSTTATVFEAYVEWVLAPTLRAGQEVVVMDNLCAHKGKRVRELVEARGCELVYLPPYSPDFNPIEEAFAKIEGLVRKAQARTRRVLVEAMGAAISARSRLRTLAASSSGTAGTAGWFNRYDERCSGPEKNRWP